MLGDLVSMIGGRLVVREDGDTQSDLRKAEKAHSYHTPRLLLPLELIRAKQKAYPQWVIPRTKRHSKRGFSSYGQYQCQKLPYRYILPVLVGKIVKALASWPLGKDSSSSWLV